LAFTVIGQLGHIGDCSNQMLNTGNYMHTFKCSATQIELVFRKLL